MGAPLPGLDGSFSNVMAFGDVGIAMSSDGIGTKVEIAERVGRYDSLGFDLMAMTVDDLAANGIEPVCLSNILDVDVLDASVVDSLMRGLHDAAKVARVAVVGGEIAELGSRIGGYGSRMHFNWCATAIGVLPKGLAPITGRELAPGHTVYSLRSRGFRSNGFSLVRRVMEAAFGPEWHNQPYEGSQTWGEVLLTPCLIYSPFITRLREEGVPVTAVAHITGGGVEDNLSRMLKSAGVGARLDNLHAPLPFMRRVQELGNIPEEQAYRLWNMGNGMLLTSPAEFASCVQATASAMGYDLCVAGTITKDPSMEIHTRGATPGVLMR
jgi:phosphoribosylformylglycinamidine cyclo-ligase